MDRDHSRHLSANESLAQDKFSKGPSIKDVRRDGGGGFGQMQTHADREEGGKGPCGRPQAGTFLYCFSMLCRHSLWMMPIKVQIDLIQFAPQSIIWAGTKAYIQLTLRVRLLIT